MPSTRHIVAVLIASLLSIPSAMAEDNTEPCGALLCLAGAMIGHGGGGACTGYIDKYFSIISWRHGHMDLGATSANRMSFLNQCPSEDPATKQAVNDRYGTQTAL
ncbi:hypothetical protein LMG28614_05659 [Paraburkholderia ultramafica]|uniref:TrbM protein n=1 Tax=Paraburkholderia ultramafica TaxID=1544867 RepID=A0A6S7D0D7_9BURK|nr:TrbM/KikA/MpfK family conjugal transfer protein [Paraburkholderia ultramafica]CAB3802624.1 hypothetical protein LMG28614_05659 [Paraburkholderia ultramafica]